MTPDASEEHRPPEAGDLRPEHIRALRLGHGGNCSSVGSVIDTLFLGAAVGGAIFAAVCAAMRDEPVRVAGADGGAGDLPPAVDSERPGEPEPEPEPEDRS